MIAAAAACLCLATSLTACGGGAKHKDSKVNTSYLYQYTANCNGGDVSSSHSNKVVLTKATGQSATVSVSDFYITVPYMGDFRVGVGSGASWSGSPQQGGNTSVTNLYWQAGSERSTLNGTIHWDSLDLDGDRYYEGNATFSY